MFSRITNSKEKILPECYFVMLYHTQNDLNPYSLDLHRKGIGMIVYTIKVEDIVIKIMKELSRQRSSEHTL